MSNIYNEGYFVEDEETLDGSAALALTLAPGFPFRLIGFEIHLSAAPTTSENITVTKDAGDGSDYDVNYFKQDAAGYTDIVQIFSKEIPCNGDDEIDFAWANTDTVDFSLKVIYRRMQ